MPKKKDIQVDTYDHPGEKRKNNPPVGLVSSATDKLNGRTEYAHDPHIAPHLSWAGKKEKTEFEVQNVSLHIHERIDPNRIVQSFPRKETEVKRPSLFEAPDNQPPLNKAVEFYQHEQDWTNRLVAGDSLLVMHSLLHKEGMAGKVQMVYIDPPYGIKYNSNFQPFVNKKEVKDNNDDDIPAEPEMIRAFRDIWELGIHSYLTSMRNRLLLAKELLHESGSIFMQINDENLNYVYQIIQEIFAPSNFIALIPFRKSSPLGAKGLPAIVDYIVWFAKNKKEIKYRQLYLPKFIGEDTGFTWVESSNGNRRKMSKKEKQKPQIIFQEDPNAKIFQTSDLNSSGLTPSCVFDFEFEGETFSPRRGYSWKTNQSGMKELIRKKRIIKGGNNPAYIAYYDDFPVKSMSNLWSDMGGAQDRIYVVQTNVEAIKRCLLMATDPGDLVLDPTCGSGTTAYVAEQWGRRWLTCDTSRVAITLAKQRLMTANFDYYELAYPKEGIRSGFQYETVPHVTLGSIAKSEPPQQETLYDQPIINKKKIRVTGPFTVEAVPSLRVRPFDGSQPKFEGGGGGGG